MSENNPDTQQAEVAWSILASLSAILCAVSLILAIPLEPGDRPSLFLIITTITTLLAAFIALFRVNSDRRQLHGRTPAVLALVIIAMVWLAIFMPRLNSRPQPAERLVCGAQLKALGKKLALYADKNNGTSYPPP